MTFLRYNIQTDFFYRLNNGLISTPRFSGFFTLWNGNNSALNIDLCRTFNRFCTPFLFNFTDYTTWNPTTEQSVSIMPSINYGTNIDTFYSDKTKNSAKKYNFDGAFKFNTDQFNFGNWDFKNIKLSSGTTPSAETNNKPALDSSFTLNLTPQQSKDLGKIKTIFDQNKSKYMAVEAATGVPAELVCAIHWRESGCNFNTYLHNGDPLGSPTKHVPVGKFFTDWTSAAIDAIKSKSYYKQVKADDIKTQYEYAEQYNGLGYRNKGVISPYVWSGTNKYSSGKYVADSKYDPNYKDKQIGVAAILNSLYETA